MKTAINIISLNYFKFLLIVFLFINFGYCLADKNGQERIDSLLLEHSKAKEDTNKIKLLNDLSFTYYSINPDKGIKFAEESKNLSEKLNWSRGLIDANSNLGVCYWMKSDFPKALEFFYKALDLSEKVDDKLGISIIQNNIGLIYLRQEKYLQSIDFFKKAIKINELLNNKSSMIKNYINISSVYSELKDFELSLKIMNTALKLSIEEKDTSTISICLTNIGEIYMYMKKFPKALDFLFQSLKLNKSKKSLYAGGNYNLLGQTYYEMAIENNQKKYLFKSIKYLKKSIACNSEIGSLFDLQKDYETIYRVYKLLGYYRNSLDYFEKYNLLKDSSFSIESKKRIAELESQREIDNRDKQILNQELKINKRDKQILNQELKINKTEKLVYLFVFITISIALISGIFVLLYIYKSKSNLKLEEKNKIISEINASKDKFFSIIAHDLKNPLANFRDVTKLLAESYNEFSEEDKLEFLKLMKESSADIYSLLENLLEWSRSQRSKISFNPENFNLNMLVVEILKLMKPSADKKMIELVNHIPVSSDINADQNMLNTIIRNLLSNAVKFTPAGGKIEVGTANSSDYFKSSDEFKAIYVKDTGLGMTKETINKLFRIDESVTGVGTDGEKGTGLGLILCKEFVEKHGGRIWVESEVGKGSTFYFTLKKI
jgi:signal transduction histidine kinase